MIKVLIDANVWDCSVTHEWVRIEKTIRWGDGSVLTILAEPQVRQIRRTVEESEAIYEALKRMGDLARSGELIPYTSNEINFECTYLPGRAGMLQEHSVFHGVPREIVDAPVRRDFVFTARKNDANCEKDAFFENVSAPRFVALRRKVAKRHLRDLYHLWTAEFHCLDCFVTLDVKFINAVTLPKPIKTPVTVCTPMNFVQRFDAGEFEP